MEIKDTVHKTNKISQMYRLINVINLWDTNWKKKPKQW